MSVPSAAPLPRRLRRVAFALTTACGGLFPLVAAAQGAPQPRLPREGDIRGVRTDGFDPDISERGDLLRVNLRARNTVIDWNGFNIPENGTIDFKDGRLLGGLLGGDVAVLNRDVSANVSQLLGKLTSDANVAVWVHNPNGILVGSKAAFNTGSLVLTTLDIKPEDFVGAGNRYRLQATANGEQSAITVLNGAKFFVKGETRGLVMIAPRIDAHGEFVAEGQDVAFVTAADVTLDYRSGSPLSVTLNRGTAVAGTSQYVRGTVAGNNALFALASQATLTDSLLRVSAEVTTASAGSRGIVLSAGRPATAVAGVTIAGDATATGGIAGITVEGPLRTQGSNAGVTARATGVVAFGGSVQTRGDLLVDAGGALAMTADLTAGGDLRLGGRGVTLGGSGTVTQRAGRQLRVTSTDGDIVGTGALTLRAAGTGDDSLLLETLGGTAGNILLGDTGRLIAGDDRRGGLTIRRRVAANDVTIGAVSARTLRGAVGTDAPAEGLRTTGALRTGNVDVREALTLEGTSVITGVLASARGIDVRSSGAVTTGAIARADTVTITASGALVIGGDVGAGGAVSLRGGSVALDGTSLRSGGAIDVAASNGGISASRGLAIVSTGDRRGDTIRLQAAGAQGIVLGDGSSITGGIDRAMAVRIFTATDAPLVLGDVTARSLGTIASFDGDPAAGGAFRSRGSLAFGRLDLVDGFTAESTGGVLSVRAIAVSGERQGIDLRAAGTLSVQNDIMAGGAITLASGAALTLGSIVSRDRAVTIASGGTLRAGTLAGATGVSASGTAVTIGTIRGGEGATQLSATAGDLTLGGASGRSVTLRADGGAVRAGGALTTTGGAVDVTATGAIEAAGAVTSTGGGVRLASSGGTVSAVGGVSSDAATMIEGTGITLGGSHVARGGYTARATAGGISRTLAATEIRSDSDASGGEGITLAAIGGAIDLADTRVTGGGTVALTTDGAGIAVGAVAAAGLTATGATADGAAIRTGDLTIGGPVTLRAAGAVTTGAIATDGAVTLGGSTVRFGNVRADSLAATATGGALTGGDIATTGAVAVTAATGAVTLGRIAATQGDIAVTAGGRLVATAVTAGGTATIVGTGTGSAVSVGEGVASVGAVTVRSAGDIYTPFIRSSTGALTVAAPAGRLAGIVPGGGTSLSAGPGQPFSLTIGTDAVLGDVIGGDIAITATAITANRIDGGTQAVTLRTTAGDLRVTGPVTGGEVSLTSAGRALLGSVAASGAVTLGGAQGLSFDTVSGASITATGGAITGVALRAPGRIDIRGGGIALDRIEAATLAAGAGGGIAIGTVTTTGDATLTATGPGSFGTVTAGGALTIGTAGGLGFDSLSGASVTASAEDGTLRGNAVRTAGAATLRGRSVELAAVETGGALDADATGGALTLGTIAAGGDATLRTTGAASITGAVSAGGTYRVTAGSIALGGAVPVTQRADGAVRLTATGGGIGATPGLTLASGPAPIVLDAAGGIDLTGTTIRTGAGSALALRAGSGQAIRLGTVEAGWIGGFDGTTALDRLTHDAGFTTGDLTVGRIAVTLGGGDLTTGRVVSGGAVSLIATGGAIRTSDLTAGTLEARAGSNLSLGTAIVGGQAVLAAAAIELPGVTAGSLAIRTAGTLGGPGGGTAAVRTTGGDLTIDAGTARLGTVESAGAATVRGDTIDIRDRLAAARALLVEARTALTLRDVTAGGDIALKATGAVTANDVGAGGTLTVDGAAVSLGATRAGGALRVTGGGAVSVGSATAGGGIALDAGGIVRAGALSGGPSVTIRAADADLTGAIRGAAVRFATRDPATTALRIGDGTAGDGFRLSAAEVALVGADTLGFDGGSGTLEIGTVALAPAAGRTVEMLSTGDVRVTGQVASTGTGRTIRIGGDAAGGHAATLHIVATSDAGGRLSLDGADVELRGNRIAAGLAPGFLDTLQPGDAGRAQARFLVGNANSPLYNPQLGGGFFAPDATTMIAARSLTVRFGDYALFQNTALPGGSSGVNVGGTIAAPVTPALRIASFGTPATASFAFFGQINGVTGAGAALLGNPVLDIDPALLPNSRINGCLAGSGAGCLTTIVIQPTLQVFDWDSQAVFGILQDVALPFTPIIGGNNEELLTGLPALAPETPEDAAAAAPPVAPTAAVPQQEPQP